MHVKTYIELNLEIRKVMDERYPVLQPKYLQHAYSEFEPGPLEVEFELPMVRGSELVLVSSACIHTLTDNLGTHYSLYLAGSTWWAWAVYAETAQVTLSFFSDSAGDFLMKTFLPPDVTPNGPMTNHVAKKALANPPEFSSQPPVRKIILPD